MQIRIRVLFQKAAAAFESYLPGGFDGHAEDSGRNQRKGDGMDSVYHGKCQGGLITGVQKLFLPGPPSLPDRPRRMDHISGFETEARRNDGFPRGAVTDGVARSLELRPSRRSKDGAADPAAGMQILIGRIDDAFHIQVENAFPDDCNGIQCCTSAFLFPSHPCGKHCQ